MIQNICHLIASREHGSLEKHVADLSRWQACNTGARVSVIAHPRYRQALDESVKFIPLNTDRSRHHPTLIWRLANHIRTGEFQIAHGHGSKSAQLLAAVQKYTDSRQVITRHNVRQPRDKLASAFDARIAVSRSAVANSRLSWNIIPNGVDTSGGPAPSLKTHRDAPPSILVATRLVKQAGIDQLLHATARLADVELVLLNDGPEKPSLERLSQELDIDQRVTFIGAPEKLGASLCAADLLVLPCRNEGAPYLLVEALLHRCAVLSSRAGNAEDYLPTDYLLDSLEPGHLAEKLGRALADRAHLRRDFEPVFERARRELTLDSMAQATWQVYTQLFA